MPHQALRNGRLRNHWTIEDVAGRLKMHPQHVEALEAGDYSGLPDPVYVRSYIRNYANLLKIDPYPLYAAYRQALSQGGVEAAATMALPRRASRQRDAVLPRSSKTRPSSLSALLPALATIPRKWIWSVGITLGALLVLGGTWLWMQGSASESAVQAEHLKEQAILSERVKNRPIVNLVKPAETNSNGDWYEVKNAKQVEVTIIPTQSTSVRIRSGGPTGAILVDKMIPAYQRLILDDPQWLSVRLDEPSNVKFLVNDVLIDTSTQHGVHLYQIKMASK